MVPLEGGEARPGEGGFPQDVRIFQAGGDPVLGLPEEDAHF